MLKSKVLEVEIRCHMAMTKTITTCTPPPPLATPFSLSLGQQQHVAPGAHPEALASSGRQIRLRRNLSRMQKQSLPQRLTPLPRQPSMLPQNVRVLRGPPLLPRSSTMSHTKMSRNTSKKSIPPTDFRGHCSRTRSGHSAKSSSSV